MVQRLTSSGAMVLRLIVLLAMLACPRLCSAQGTWSVISLPQQPSEVTGPQAVGVDGLGNLYVADADDGSRIQKRDAQGRWSVIADEGEALGQVKFGSGFRPLPTCLAETDGMGSRSGTPRGVGH
jgi:hypothetical protein